MFPGIDTRTMKLESIKDVYVKKGFFDTIMGTGSIYPISLNYPYLPKTYVYSGSSEHGEGIYSSKEKRVYNAATKEYEMVPQFLLHRKTRHHPHFSGIKEWRKVEQLIKERIISTKRDF